MDDNVKKYLNQWREVCNDKSHYYSPDALEDPSLPEDVKYNISIIREKLTKMGINTESVYLIDVEGTSLNKDVMSITATFNYDYPGITK